LGADNNSEQKCQFALHMMASLAAIVATLAGMILMFILGIQTGAREVQPSKKLPRSAD
jgi:hypothetical protein